MAEIFYKTVTSGNEAHNKKVGKNLLLQVFLLNNSFHKQNWTKSPQKLFSIAGSRVDMMNKGSRPRTYLSIKFGALIIRGIIDLT